MPKKIHVKSLLRPTLIVELVREAMVIIEMVIAMVIIEIVKVVVSFVEWGGCH